MDHPGCGAAEGPGYAALLRARPAGSLPQRRVAGYKGFFYHFLDLANGHRFGGIELSTIDTALLLAGMLFCQSYFGGQDAEEAEIRALAETIYGRVDWRWAQQPADRSPAITLGWTPEAGFNRYSWRTYNEAAIIYLLALGSPNYPVEPQAWLAWQQGFDNTWGLNFGPQPHVGYPSSLVHQYPHVWVDFRGIRDDYMRGRDLDYFENSRRAAYAQRAYATANPLGWKGYGEDVWGLTACDGPGNLRHDYRGQPRRFHGYTARGPGRNDDGTLAPTAVLGSIAFAPGNLVLYSPPLCGSTGTTANRSSAPMASSTPSTPASISPTCRQRSAGASPASAGSARIISASTRGRSWP